MAFMNKLEEQITENDLIQTENGAWGYRSTGNALLDINYSVPAMRRMDEDEIASKFWEAFREDKTNALKWLFFYRDIRGGLGERRGFRAILKWLANNEPEILKAIIPLVPNYGRYDDLFVLLEYSFPSDIRDCVLDFIKAQFSQDMCAMRLHKPVSLLAKWLPSASTNNKDKICQRRFIQKKLNLSNAEYRKELSKLRAYIDVVEVKMSANRWGEIAYESVPSRANLLYKGAFLKHDEERRREFLAKVERGETKINSSILFPHEIVHSYIASGERVYRGIKIKYDASLESMWKALPDLVQECGNVMVVADGSGSMLCEISNNVTALDVSNALAIYFSERSSGEFKNKYITFSSRPELVDLSNCKDLREKLIEAYKHNDCSNTNIEATFRLILNTAVQNHVSRNDMPKTVLIISDMEFDGATTYYSDKAALFKHIANEYKSAGYTLPGLVFWNVNSRTGAIPMRENENGVALVGGFSANICKMVMSGKLDPYECLLETINSERYQPVEEAIHNLVRV